MTSCAYPSVYITASTPQPSFVAENTTLIFFTTVLLATAVAAYLANTWVQRGTIITAGMLIAAGVVIIAVNTAMTQCPDRPELRVHDERFETKLHEQNKLYYQPIAAFDEDAVLDFENHTVRCISGCDAFTITDNATTMTPSEEFDEYVGLQPCYANHTIYVRGPDSDASLPVCDIPERLMQ